MKHLGKVKCYKFQKFSEEQKQDNSDLIWVSGRSAYTLNIIHKYFIYGKKRIAQLLFSLIICLKFVKMFLKNQFFIYS